MDTTHPMDTTHRTCKAAPPGPERRRWPRLVDHEWDAVHDAALDSFPASDPPSWSPLRAGAPSN